MNILLSNDDGYQADGIRILEEVLVSHGHTVYVSAPEGEQSGKSHSMTIRGEIAVTKYGERHFHISGTPADCIVYSHRSALFPVNFDAVISGINHGYNLSTDVIYSGTCAAARQATMYGIKAIAVSLQRKNEEKLRLLSAFVADNLERFLSVIPEGAFMNINAPLSFDGSSYEKAGLGFIVYDDQVSIKETHGDRIILEITDCDLIHHPSSSKYRADHEICNDGKASISIVNILPDVDEKAMEFLR